LIQTRERPSYTRHASWNTSETGQLLSEATVAIIKSNSQYKKIKKGQEKKPSLPVLFL
jgi:hypothetical protein